MGGPVGQLDHARARRAARVAARAHPQPEPRVGGHARPGRRGRGAAHAPAAVVRRRPGPRAARVPRVRAHARAGHPGRVAQPAHPGRGTAAAGRHVPAGPAQRDRHRAVPGGRALPVPAVRRLDGRVQDRRHRAGPVPGAGRRSGGRRPRAPGPGRRRPEQRELHADAGRRARRVPRVHEQVGAAQLVLLVRGRRADGGRGRGGRAAVRVRAPPAPGPRRRRPCGQRQAAARAGRRLRRRQGRRPAAGRGRPQVRRTGRAPVVDVVVVVIPRVTVTDPRARPPSFHHTAVFKKKKIKKGRFVFKQNAFFLLLSKNLYFFTTCAF